MKLLRVLSPLSAGRMLIAAFALLSFGLALIFIFRTIEIGTSGSEIRVELDTSQPHKFFLLGVLSDARRGWHDGYAAGEHVKLDSIYVPRKKISHVTQIGVRSAEFELIQESQVRWLRYTESNPWKRLGMYYLGASSRTLSLASVLYYLLGSWLLLRLLFDVTLSTPFTTANARRLRNLTLLVLGLFFAQELAYGALRGLMPVFRSPNLAEPLSHYVLLNSENTLPNLNFVLVLAIIAVVYQRGVDIYQEAELTV